MADRETIEIIVEPINNNEIKNTKKSIDDLGQSAKKNNVSIDELQRQIDELCESSEDAGQEIDGLGEEIDDLGGSANNTGNAYNDFMGKLKKAAGITAVVAGTKKAIDIFVSFDDEMRKVQAATGATGQAMDLLRFQAQDLGKSTRYSATEAASAQFEFSKAGFDSNAILAATPGILNTATAAGIGLAEATEITAGTLRMFGLAAGESNRVGDVLAKTANSTSTDVLGLGESLKYAGKDSADFKMSLEETAAVLGSLGNEMLKDSSAGTGLQAVFASFKDKRKAKILIDAGIQLSEDGEYRNFLDIMKDLQAKTSTMTEVETKSLVNQVFGDQGSRVVNRLLDQNQEDLNRLIKDLEAAEGYSAEIAATMDGGMGGAFKNLNSAIEGASISFVANLEPAIISVTNAVTTGIAMIGNFFDWLNSGSYAANTLTFGISALTTTFLVYKSVLGIASLWTGAVTVVTGLLNMTMLPTVGIVGLIVGAVVGLGVGFAVLYQKSERFRKTLEPLTKGLKNLWEWVSKFKLVSKAIEGAKALGTKVKDFFTAGATKTAAAQQKQEIEKIKAAAGKTDEQGAMEVAGAGINTDYLLTKGGKSGVKHNGYYLKGTKNLYSSSTSNSSNGSNTQNIYNKEFTESQESPFEEKVLTLLRVIAETLKKKNDSSVQNQYIINNQTSKEDFINFMEDLKLAILNS